MTTRAALIKRAELVKEALQKAAEIDAAWVKLLHTPAATAQDLDDAHASVQLTFAKLRAARKEVLQHEISKLRSVNFKQRLLLDYIRSRTV